MVEDVFVIRLFRSGEIFAPRCRQNESLMTKADSLISRVLLLLELLLKSLGRMAIKNHLSLALPVLLD